MQFAEEVYATVETSGAVTVCVNKSQETAIPFTVILRPDGQTATGKYKLDQLDTVWRVFFMRLIFVELKFGYKAAQ